MQHNVNIGSISSLPRVLQVNHDSMHIIDSDEGASLELSVRRRCHLIFNWCGRRGAGGDEPVQLLSGHPELRCGSLPRTQHTPHTTHHSAQRAESW
jgi:hypothetical protein